ncbi:S-adenosyl-L-methionine-dependent methyltransferase [Peziza echinospora]|nr:S-adenosyl-L-methionine-dependent methyltransferase [Peziza echinospora]
MSQTTSEPQSSVQGTESYEAEHVHRVYEIIAPHFSATRFKPWPIVEKFLKELRPGSVGLDVGCGNGKYMAVNPNVFIIGSDRSHNLVKFAATHKQHDALVADALDLPHPCSRFDFAISIAVIHHFSSTERRAAAIESILSMLKPKVNGLDETGGKALIYVWALEQKNSRRGWDETSNQDVFVPWVLQKKFTVKDDKTTGQANQPQAEVPNRDKTYQRYYHLYRKGELEDDVSSAGGAVIESGYEKDNWWAIVQRNN